MKNFVASDVAALGEAQRERACDLSNRPRAANSDFCHSWSVPPVWHADLGNCKGEFRHFRVMTCCYNGLCRICNSFLTKISALRLFGWSKLLKLQKITRK
jgi:hypothetical protein